MDAITNMCYRIEGNVSSVTNQINNLEKRIGSYENQISMLNDSRVISALNESKIYNNNNS